MDYAAKSEGGLRPPGVWNRFAGDPRAFGLAVVVVLAVCCRLMAWGQHLFPDVAFALATGIALRAMLGERAALAKPGVDFVLRYVLRTAIVLFGAGLSLEAVLAAGSETLALVVSCCVLAFGLGLLFARFSRMSRNLGILIGAGTAICGASAILAIAPILEASTDETAYAITTIFTFNVIALFLYPLVGHALAMTATAFGSWVGTAVNDTSVVVATGFAFSPDAGSVATIVKLSRTVLLVPLALGIGFWIARRPSRSSEGRSLLPPFPWFVLGFVAVAGLNSVHVLSPSVDRAATAVAAFLIVCVLAAVGLNTDLAKIFRRGMRPLVVGCLLATVMAGCSLFLIRLFHIA